MRRFVLIAALVLASASAQAGAKRSLSSSVTPNDPPIVTNNQKEGVVTAQARDSRSLSSGATANDVTATTTQAKPDALSAQSDGAATTAPAPQAIETPRYAPPPGTEAPRYVAPPAPPAAEAPKPVDTTRNSETPTQTPVQTPTETQAPRYTARPAPVDNTPTAATPPSTRQHMPPREARYRHGRSHHADYSGSDYWPDYGWGYERPHFRTPHWSTRRIIAALHRYGLYW